MAAIEPWSRVQTLREISTALTSRGGSALFGHPAAGMSDAATPDNRFKRAKREYDRIASYI